ncbi:class F sortase [Streptomyces niveus]|uniref:class F sortase n=1 Tax=Streptomyces niveus TaxID=193462 RepID=UPI001F4003D1|nr:class F sortase [Streptomyces niveus]
MNGGGRSHRRTALIVAIPVLLVVGGLLLALGLGVGTGGQHPAPPRAVDKSGPPVADSAPRSPTANPDADRSAGSGPDKKQAAAALPASDPVRVTIPSLKVSSTLERLGLDKNRAMETPKDPDKAGWYHPGPAPGANGPSVIAGHVTWDGAPTVFFDLARIDPGDRVEVAREDGRTAEFTVDRVATYAKDAFPTVEVYRNLDHAGLRLITCGGEYSEADRRYADNVVVYATLTGSHRSTPDEV